MEFSYDNTAQNERNPNHPPERVRTGTRSVDEMGNVTFQAMPVHPQELDALLESKYRRQLGRAPSADALYNLANALARQTTRAEAAVQYQAAIAKDPQLSAARYNYAGLLLAEQTPAQAIPQLERVLELRPEDIEARLALGHALELVGRVDQAIAQYRAIVSADPKQAMAQRMLADALRKLPGR
jgi:tetratricopeptide (TPR) repeat protein